MVIEVRGRAVGDVSPIVKVNKKVLYDKSVDFMIFADVVSIKSDNSSLPLLKPRAFGVNWGIIDGASNSCMHVDRQLHLHMMWKVSYAHGGRCTLDFDVYVQPANVRSIRDFIDGLVDSLLVPVEYAILKVRNGNRAYRCTRSMHMQFKRGPNNEVVITSEFAATDKVSGETSDFAYMLSVSKPDQIERIKLAICGCKS